MKNPEIMNKLDSCLKKIENFKLLKIRLNKGPHALDHDFLQLSLTKVIKTHCSVHFKGVSRLFIYQIDSSENPHPSNYLISFSALNQLIPKI